MFDVVVVGSANLDLVAAVSQIPAPGETVLAARFEEFIGGKGSNQAVASARLGSQVAFVGKTGTDAGGKMIRDGLTAEGINIDSLGKSDQHSGTAWVMLDPAAENAIVVIPGANADLLPADVTAARELIAGAKVVVCQYEVPVATVEAAAQVCTQTFILNPAPAAPVSDELLANLTVLVVNETEFECVFEQELPQDLEAFAAAVASSRAADKLVVATLGSRGAFAWTGAEAVHIPAPKVKVVDTTGAGDTFIGALADAISGGEDLFTAVKWAVQVSAFAVGQLGATTGMPTRSQVLQAQV